MWGFTRHGVAPDIVTMGKPMGNGFPMAGLAGRHELFAQFCEDTGYFNTFGGNPVAAAAGMAVLDCIEQEDLIGNARRSGSLLMEGLASVAAENNRIRALRGAGLFIAIELAETDQPAGEAVVRLIDALRRRRVLIGAAGRYGETLKLRPPLCLSSEEAAFFLDALRLALREI
jgi:4-aminobutyrate aminotransferase-like enzyme